MAHGGERKGVEPRARKELVKLLFLKWAEHAAARGVHEDAYLRLLLFEQRLIFIDAAEIRQVECDGTDGIAALCSKLLKAQELGVPVLSEQEFLELLQ